MLSELYTTAAVLIALIWGFGEYGLKYGFCTGSSKVVTFSWWLSTVLIYIPAGILFLGGFSFNALTLFAAVLYISAVYLYLYAASSSPISWVSVIVSSYSIIPVVLAIAVLGETLSLQETATVTAIILGVILLLSAKKSGPGVGSPVQIVQALGASICAGLAFFIISLPSVNLGGVLIFFALGLSVMLNPLKYCTPFSSMIEKNSRKALFLVSISVAMFQGGFIAYFLLIRSAPLTLIVPITASYPAFTVLFARFLLREHLTKQEIVGISMVIPSLIILSSL